MFQDIKPIIGLLEDQTVAQGEYVFRKGDEDPYFYLIVSGSIEVYDITPSGQKKIFGVVLAGYPLGEGALSNNTKNHIRPANAVALEKTRLLKLHRNKFEQLLIEKPESAATFLYSLLEITYARLRLTNAELITFYEIGRLIGIYGEDLETLVRQIFEQLKNVTNSRNALMVIRDKLSGENEIFGDKERFAQLDFNKLHKLDAGIFNTPQELEAYGLGERKVLLARIDGIGFLLLTRAKTQHDYSENHFKLIVSVAEQARAAIERAWKYREKKAKELYQRRKGQYVF